MRHTLKALAFLFCIAAPLAAQQHRFTLDDFSHVNRVNDPQISPDGKSVIVVVSKPNLDEDRYDPELVQIDIASGKSKTLVTGLPGLSFPRYSPDGQTIAFLASVGATGPALSVPGGNGRLQIHVMKAGAAPRMITNAASGVQQFTWSPDGSSIAFAAMDVPEKKNGPERFNDSFEVMVNDDFLTNADKYPTHLWLVSAGGGGERRLTNGSWSLPVSHPPGPPASAITWTLDGAGITFARQESAHGRGNELFTVNVKDGSLTPLKKSGRNLSGTFPMYNAATNTLAFMSNGVSVWTPSDTAGRPITRDIDHGMDRALWMPDGKSMLVGSNDSMRVSLYIQPVDGKGAKRLELGGVSPANSYYVDMMVGKNGGIAFTASSPTRPSELYYMSSPDAEPRRLTDVNGATASLSLGKTEMIEWKNDKFYENGTLTYPPDFDPSQKYPLVLVIHGGPRGASLLSWSSQAQLLAAKGWLVFQPNYRGSDHLGNAYQSAIRNDAGAGPGRDVMAGIDAIKAKGIVDMARVGVSGWSYGGYMTTWMIGHYDIWKVAVAGAAVTDQLDQQMLGDGANLRGENSPWVNKDAMDRIHEQSPISYVSKMKTPTLIMSNVGDYRVPITQSYKLFHALKDYGVTTQFIAYPIAGHNAADPVRQRDVQRRWMGWLEQYLGAAGATQKP
ncbi:MAG TPA: S9 family peptidase [Gemmatimonadaceae bacterium]|nr:S9 family peptidase [Gemmatimonadaceae bacterium]